MEIPILSLARSAQLLVQGYEICYGKDSKNKNICCLKRNPKPFRPIDYIKIEKKEISNCFRQGMIIRTIRNSNSIETYCRKNLD